MTETVVDCVCFDCEREPCVECLYVSFPFRPPQPNTPTTTPQHPQGTFAMVVRAGTAPLAYNFMVQAFGMLAPVLPDFVKYNKER